MSTTGDHCQMRLETCHRPIALGRALLLSWQVTTARVSDWPGERDWLARETVYEYEERMERKAG